MWAPGDVVPQHRCRGVVIWTSLVLAIVTYSGWLLHKAVEKTKAPDTSFVISNKVYEYPDLWICPYVQYGCDTRELEEDCVASAWETEGGPPDAIFYPRETLDQTTTEELEIVATAEYTNDDEEGNPKEGRGHCVVFETSAADAFVGQERSSAEYLDYILLDLYWNPGGLNENSTTCVPDGQERQPHSQWAYAFLSDSETEGMVSTGIQLSYSCITATSNTYTFNTVGIGRTDQNKYDSEDLTSFKAQYSNVGMRTDEVNPNITVPYARLSMQLKQQFDSWVIITEANPFEFAEMFGNIGGFWDLLVLLWPIFFVATTRQEPHLKPRNFKKAIVRGVERAAGITTVIPRPGPRRRSSSVDLGDTTNDESLEEGPPWEMPKLEREGSAFRRTGNHSRVSEPGE